MTWRDPLPVALLAIVSVGAARWVVRTIVEQLAERKRVKVRHCPGCGGAVMFYPAGVWDQIRKVKARDLVDVGVQVGHVVAAAEAGIPPTFHGFGSPARQVPPAPEPSAFAQFCQVGKGCVLHLGHEGECLILGPPQTVNVGELDPDEESTKP